MAFPYKFGSATTPDRNFFKQLQQDFDSGLRLGIEADLNIYVNGTTGSNSNSGLTAAKGKLTIQAAVNLAARYGVIIAGDGPASAAGPFVTVNVAAGTYNETVVLPKISGAYALYSMILLGDTTTPSNVVINAPGTPGCIYTESMDWKVHGFKFTNTGAAAEAACVYADNGGMINTGKCEYGIITNGYHLFARAGGRIIEYEDQLISAGARSHWQIQAGGIIQAPSGKTITLTGTPNFSYSFAGGGGGGVIWCGGITFVGGATGTRYLPYGNAVVDTSNLPHSAGGGANYLPGNGAGVLATGGQYV